MKTNTAMGGTPEQMLKADVKAEEEAITLYKEIIGQAISEGDDTTQQHATTALVARQREDRLQGDQAA